jgi:hypothetical protein
MKHTATMLLGMTLGVIITLSATPNKSSAEIERREQLAVKQCIGTTPCGDTTAAQQPLTFRF